MKIRQKSSELEAHLRPADPATQLSNPSGKVELKTYTNGIKRLKVKIRNVALDDGSIVDFTIAGKKWGDLRIISGKAEVDIETAEAGTFPEAAAQDKAEIKWQGETILIGELQYD